MKRVKTGKRDARRSTSDNAHSAALPRGVAPLQGRQLRGALGDAQAETEPAARGLS